MPVQATLTDKYQVATWNCNRICRLNPHIHYRMAAVEVGYALRHLLGTKELIHATFKAFIGELMDVQIDGFSDDS